MARFRQSAGSRPSLVLIFSYVWDWVIVVAIALIGYGFYHVTPHAHAFSVLDLSISYPLHADTVSISVAAVVSVIIPAVVTFAVVLFLVPGPSATMRIWREGGARKIIALKLWEWNTVWLGLALSLAAAFTITQGSKLFGKPRPNMLARCQPDLNAIDRFTVGGYGQDISQRWVLVTRDICTNPDPSVVNDGFQSWPSGHSSLAWSGLLYFTLWLCAKFSVVLPYLPSQALAPEPGQSQGPPWRRNKANTSIEGRRPILKSDGDAQIPFTVHRDEAAAPPTWLTFLIFLPVGGAVYICGSRYFDYAHHGFDIISGAVVGIVTSYIAFRWYHLPISKGSGWSWGPRSRDRAFGVGVGYHGFVDQDRQFEVSKSASRDVELGSMHTNGDRDGAAWTADSRREPEYAANPEFQH